MKGNSKHDATQQHQYLGYLKKNIQIHSDACIITLFVSLYIYREREQLSLYMQVNMSALKK